MIQRQAERTAAGKRARGRPPKATLSQQQALLAQMEYVADGVRYLCQQLHTMLEVVVLNADRILSSEQRQGEIEALLDLLDEVAPLAIPALQKHIEMLAKQLRLALPQTLLFARQLDAMQERARASWVPRRWLCWRGHGCDEPCLVRAAKHCCKALPSDWRAEASLLLTGWEQAVRASSAVENWHSIVRPHLAVHRTLSAGMLALLAVWHNHRIAPRGLHEGLSPLQRTGSNSPREIGWQLWAILLSLPDCSKVSHGFEPCLNRSIKRSAALFVTASLAVFDVAISCLSAEFSILSNDCQSVRTSRLR